MFSVDEPAAAMRGLTTEFGVTVPKGIRKLYELMTLVDTAETIPQQAKQAVTGLHDYCNDLSEGIETFEAEIVTHTRTDETARRLATISGIGPITASLIAATVVDIDLFKTARQFAWVGLVPRQNSTGGMTRLGRITKTGKSGWWWQLLHDGVNLKPSVLKIALIDELPDDRYWQSRHQQARVAGSRSKLEPDRPAKASTGNRRHHLEHPFPVLHRHS